METKKIDFSELPNSSTILKMRKMIRSLANVFDERKGTYINELNLFIACFNTIPNFNNEINIDCKKALSSIYEGHLRCMNLCRSIKRSAEKSIV